MGLIMGLARLPGESKQLVTWLSGRQPAERVAGLYRHLEGKLTYCN